MGTSHPALDPRIEEVLRDIAAGASSGLLTVDPRKLVTGLSAERIQVGVAQAGLTSAERELLDAHREEVARLLLEAWMVRLVADPRARLMHPHGRLGGEEWNRRARDAGRSSLRSEERDAPFEHGLTLLEASVRAGGAEHGPEATALLLASLRLADRPGTRVCLANDAFARGETRSALRIAEGVIELHSRPAITQTAWQVVGRSLELLVGVDSARAAYGRALELCHREQLAGAVLAIPLMNALIYALRAGARADALEHARLLEECAGAGDDIVRRQVAFVCEARASGMQVPQVVRSIADELDVRDDGAAREVIDALA